MENEPVAMVDRHSIISETESWPFPFHRVRGRLCTVLVLASSGGTLLGFMAGHFLEYAETPRFSLLFSVLFIATFSFMPETPYYLMKTNRMEVCIHSNILRTTKFSDRFPNWLTIFNTHTQNRQEAEKSLRFYRCMTKTPTVQESKAFEYELSKLKYSYTEMQRKDSDSTANSPLCIADFINRPFSICCVLMFAHEVCGVFTMTSYASVIFAKSGSTISPGISSIIVGAIQVVGSYISTLFVDRLGRKVCVTSNFEILIHRIGSLIRSPFSGFNSCWWWFHSLELPSATSF